MKGKKEDRRIQRTRELLTNALLSLIQEKGFEVLTVQDILDRANVGRSTFYAHFQGKEDLLLRGIDTLHASLQDMQQRALHEGGEAFAFRHWLFRHIDEQRKVFRAMIGRRSGSLIEKRFQQVLLDLILEDLRAQLPQEANDPALLESMARFVAGGMYGMLAGWIDGRRRLPVDELSDQFGWFAKAIVSERLKHV